MNDGILVELGDAKDLTMGLDEFGRPDGTEPETYEEI